MRRFWRPPLLLEAPRTPGRATASTAGLGNGQRVVAHVGQHPKERKAVLVHEHHALEPVGIRKDGSGGDLTGLRVWEAAPVLVQYLETHAADLVEGRRVLDVGAGTGGVGLAAAMMGAKAVVLSEADTPASAATPHGWQTRSTLALLADNVALNGGAVAAVTSVAELKWGCREHAERLFTSTRPPDSKGEGEGEGFDTLTLSDVLYYTEPEIHEALADTVRTLAKREGASVVVAYKVRHGHEHTFFRRLTAGRAGEDDDGGGGGGGFERVVRSSTAPSSECVGPSGDGGGDGHGGGGGGGDLELAPRNAIRVVELRRVR